jgi:hypothetical protein
MTHCSKAKYDQEKVRAYLPGKIPALAVDRKSREESFGEDF